MNTTENFVAEDVSCPLGCVKDDEVVLIGRDLLHNLPGEFKVVKCRVCGLMRTNPRPTLETIGYYYPDDYGPYVSTQISSEPNDSKAPGFLKRQVRRILRSNSNLLPDVLPGRMLEIGCASGAFLHQMLKKGWEVTGIEFSSKAAVEASKHGFSVYSGAIEDAPAPSEPYDMIVAWMVLEHLHNPVNTLKKIHGWTHKDSRLVLSIPDAGSWEFRAFKDKWYALHLPNHLFHYNRETLTKVLEAGGWRVERIFWHKNPNNLLSGLSYVFTGWGWNGAANFLVSIVKGKRLRYLHAILGLILGYSHASGRMTVWAKRD